jgi:ubiquinone/menaquinone biosynthesis C-methylase UbiE
LSPWWFGYTFDNTLTWLVHNPEKILRGLIGNGQTVLDIGCGMGFFSISMAKMVGENGTVIAVDLQQNMLKVLRHRAERNGVLSRIRAHECKNDDIGISDPVDFALAFWVVHEIPNKKRLFEQIYSLLKAGGRILFCRTQDTCFPWSVQQNTGVRGTKWFEIARQSIDKIQSICASEKTEN